MPEHVTSHDGMPFDFKKKITCEHCRQLIWKQRRELMEKYGWKSWPEELKGSLEGE